jgi:GNAT superfamily N-acetyltransferase
MEFVRPSQDNIGFVFDLIIKSDIAEYGEADSELSDLQHEWGGMDLSQDVWVAKQGDEFLGYAAVVPSRGELRFDVYIHPEKAAPDLATELLTMCEMRTHELLSDQDISTHTFLAHINKRDTAIFQHAGFDFVKSCYQMHIDLTEDLAQPKWPAGVSLRTAQEGIDDVAIYQAVQLAFERQEDKEPTFEQWRSHMIRCDVYDPDLWLLAVAGEDIVGTCLGIKYETGGWIRQFGVIPAWRGKGIATAILREAFIKFRMRGYARVGLGMEADNKQALRLYDRVGMKVLRQYDEYRKVYTPEKDMAAG